MVVRLGEVRVVHKHQHADRTSHRQLAHVAPTSRTFVELAAEPNVARADVRELCVTLRGEHYIVLLLLHRKSHLADLLVRRSRAVLALH